MNRDGRQHIDPGTVWGQRPPVQRCRVANLLPLRTPMRPDDCLRCLPDTRSLSAESPRDDIAFRLLSISDAIGLVIDQVPPRALYTVACSLQSLLVDLSKHTHGLEARCLEHSHDARVSRLQFEEQEHELHRLAGHVDALSAERHSLLIRVQELESALAEHRFRLRALVGPQRDFPPGVSPVDVRASPFSVRPELATLAARSQSSPASRHRDRFEDLSDDDGAGTWRGDTAAPTFSRSRDLSLEAHVERLNAIQHAYAVTGPPTDYRRTLPYRKEDYANRARIDWHVLPAERPPDAPKLPGPRYPMAKVDHYKLKTPWKLILSPAGKTFVQTSLTFFRSFDSELTYYGLGGLFRALCTRRLRVVGATSSQDADMSRVMRMLSLASEPYGGLSRFSTWWHVAVADSTAALVYIDVADLISLDEVLTHVLSANADSHCKKFIVDKSKGLPAYELWCKFCNFSYGRVDWSESLFREECMAYLNGMVFDSKRGFVDWEADVRDHVRTMNFLFDSNEYCSARAYIDLLWRLLGVSLQAQHRTSIELHGYVREDHQIVLAESDLPGYLNSMALCLRSSSTTGPTVGAVSVSDGVDSLRAEVASLQRVLQAGGRSRPAPHSGTPSASAQQCRMCQQAPCRSVCPNCLSCKHALADCDRPGGPKFDTAATNYADTVGSRCVRCQTFGHSAWSRSCHLKLPDLRDRVFHGKSHADSRIFATERAKSSTATPPSSTSAGRGRGGKGGKGAGTHTVGVPRPNGDVGRGFRLNRGADRFAARVGAIMAQHPVSAPSAGSVSAPPPAAASTKAVDKAFLAALERQFAAQRSQAAVSGAVTVVFGLPAAAALGEPARHPPFFGYHVVDTAKVDLSLADRLQRCYATGTIASVDGCSPVTLVPYGLATSGYCQVQCSTLRLSNVRVRGVVDDSSVTEPLYCGDFSVKFSDRINGVRHEKLFGFISKEVSNIIFSEVLFTSVLGYALVECRDPLAAASILPSWAVSHADVLCTGNRFLLKRLADGTVVALELTAAGDMKYKCLLSVPPEHADYRFFKQLCATPPDYAAISQLPSHPLTPIERQRLEASIGMITAAPCGVGSVAAVPDRTALEHLARETIAAHDAGADYGLMSAALCFQGADLVSQGALDLPDGLLPKRVCSRCEREGCAAGLACTRPCALCDAPHGHEDCCLRRDCADATIERFLPQDDQPAAVDCGGGVQAVYAAAVDTEAPTSVSGAPAPAVPQADLDLLARVQPDLLQCLSNLPDEHKPCTPAGLPLSVVFPDLALSERLELCRLYERTTGRRHNRTVRNAAKADFAALCTKGASEFPSRT